jgi:hypothetical protein
MESLSSCPRCGREAKHASSSRVFRIHTCLNSSCGVKYCTECGDDNGTVCPECGATEDNPRGIPRTEEELDRDQFRQLLARIAPVAQLPAYPREVEGESFTLVISMVRGSAEQVVDEIYEVWKVHKSRSKRDPDASRALRTLREMIEKNRIVASINGVLMRRSLGYIAVVTVSTCS